MAQNSNYVWADFQQDLAKDLFWRKNCWKFKILVLNNKMLQSDKLSNKWLSLLLTIKLDLKNFRKQDLTFW